MDSHPVVRRKARRDAPRLADAPARQTFADPIVLLVTDDDGFTLPVDWPVLRGDPADPRVAAFLREIDDVSAVVALSSNERGQAVAAAIARLNPNVAVLLVGDQERRAALRERIEQELHRLEALKRVRALQAFAEGADTVPILIHQDPDPDALASALAVRVLLRREPNDAPILTLDEVTRPENRRMAELLDIQVTQVTQHELMGFARLICVDMQPRDFRGDGAPRLAVIDHHPPENSYHAEYIDIRPSFGATATMLTEYIRVLDERWLGKRLATALAYAIKTDTDNLTRGVSPADVAAYTFLLERVDAPLLRRIERPAYAEHTARAFGRGIADMALCGDVAVAWLGQMKVDDSHILADVADFCLAMDEATWAAAAAIVADRLVINIRHLGSQKGAGEVARMMASDCGGSGGGHATMARAVLNLEKEWGTLRDAPPEKARGLLLERISSYVERAR